MGLPAMAEDASRENAYPIGKYPAVNQDVFLVSRAVAIQAYAHLELSLSMLFSSWLGTPPDVGGLVFFRITSKYAISRILDDLKTKRLQDKYNLFWNSFLSLLRALDQRRNEIVHWHTVNNIDLSVAHESASKLSLAPPTGWATKSDASLNESDLADFAAKCEFASRLSVMFFAVNSEHSGDVDKAWHDIFQQPIAYPPPDTHPLSPNYKAPETLPQS
jgi:hypothetical protein